MAFAEGQRFEGTVTSWKPPWGWVTSPGVEGDVFVHQDDVSAGSVEIGVNVTFEVGTHAKTGKPRAINIEVLGSHAVAGGDGMRVQGVVKSFKPPWGWVSKPTGDGDVFAHLDDVVDGKELQEGQRVSYVMGLDEKTGRPRALRIEAVGPWRSSDGPTVGTGRSAGIVTNWREKWGWITGLDAEGDVFAHEDDVLNGAIPHLGAEVTFVIGNDKQGRRRAKQIVVNRGGQGGSTGGGIKPAQAALPQPGPKKQTTTPTFAPKGKGSGGFTTGGKGKDKGKGKAVTNGPADFFGMSMEGHVTVWKDKWGWVSNPNFQGSDIFAHIDDVLDGSPPAVGTHVKFVVGCDAKGRVRALAIRPATAPAAAGAAATKGKKRKAPVDKGFEAAEGEVLEGTVASWKTTWGWVRTEGFSGDVFAHRDDVVDASEPQVGQTVQYTVGRDEKSGRWRALGIVLQ